MHGHIHLCYRELVQVYFGQEAWLQVLAEADLDDDNDFMLFHYYDDSRTIALVQAVAKVVDMELPVLLELFGKHFYKYAATRGYDRMMRTLGRDFQTFVQNLDLLHSLLALTYKGMRPPHFRSEKKDGKLYVHVYTVRPALYPVAIGTLKEVAKQIFNTEIDMVVVERNTGKIFKNVYSEHVITEVKVIGEDRGITSNTETKDTNIQKIMNDNNDEGSELSENFVVSERSINTALPYSIVFNKDMYVRSAGLHLKTLCPELEDPRVKINEIFEIKEPRVEFTYDSIMSCSTSYMYFFLNCKEYQKGSNGIHKPECPILRGHMVPLQGMDEIMFISSPFFESLGDLLDASSFLTNIPQDQITMEIMFMNEQRIADVEMSKKLDESTAMMKKLANALENEKKKTDTLLYEMLPYKVANQLREGKSVEAEKHAEVTILFSDIVTFTNIAAGCEPIQIVGMLNELFRRFDDLSTQHGVYKVETIGDAYMVAAGVPDAMKDHAERVAFMGLDMVEETGHVISPVTQTPINIRVGIHTGPVVSGVVGNRMPRFCLFGDTVNTASRMESHGVPGKIHISDSAYRALKDKGFFLESRGEIEVKGKGMMETYFVIGVDTDKIKPLPKAAIKKRSVIKYTKESICLSEHPKLLQGIQESKTEADDGFSGTVSVKQTLVTASVNGKQTSITAQKQTTLNSDVQSANSEKQIANTGSPKRLVLRNVAASNSTEMKNGTARYDSSEVRSYLCTII